MSDPERPFLVLLPPRQVTKLERPKPRGGAAGPNKARQVVRLSPQFAVLQAALAERRAALQADPAGVAPEQVLVFETNGPVSEFYGVVANTPGLAWLAAEELRDLDPDEDFFDRKKPTKPISARSYLVMTNEVALRQLLSVWDDWSNDRGLPEPLRAWQEVFRKLRTIRRWSVQDRLEETGILERWREQLAENTQYLEPFEIELWHRDPAERVSAIDRVRRLVEAERGRIVHRCELEPIAYCALLVDMPAPAVARILADRTVALVSCDDVRLFRPSGQGVRRVRDDRPVQNARPALPDSRSLAPPVVGLLDGLPLENHALLAQRLVVDDPDGFGERYEAVQRQHGTAMASLILHGDLAAGEPGASRKLFVHPIMTPHPASPLSEAPPTDRLWVDVIHRAVRRALEGEGGEAPTAPTVRVFNLSVGDGHQPFIRAMSALARLLDWLSWKHKVLFVVSAGNHFNRPISVEASPGGDGMEQAVLKALHDDHRNRRLLAPAETVNGLTVGATHEDAAGPWSPSASHEGLIVSTLGLPSPISGLGRGYRRAVKPDLLAPGGRVVFTRAPDGDGTRTAFVVSDRLRLPPGQTVAAPSVMPGDLRGTTFTCGTSNSTALTTRLAARIHDIIEGLSGRPEGTGLTRVPISLWLKTLLVHTADWPVPAFGALAEALRTKENARTFADQVSAFLGYGVVRQDRAMGCAFERATLLGCGSIGADETWVHRIPLPGGLHTFDGWRRVTITLAWFSPTNPRHQQYRRAALAFVPPAEGKSPLRVSRDDADWRAVTRGTVQHEVLERSSGAIDLPSGEPWLEIPVVCSAEAGGLDDRVPYALAVTLEVAPGVRVAIYDQIRDRLRTPIKPTP